MGGGKRPTLANPVLANPVLAILIWPFLAKTNFGQFNFGSGVCHGGAPEGGALKEEERKVWGPNPEKIGPQRVRNRSVGPRRVGR